MPRKRRRRIVRQDPQADALADLANASGRPTRRAKLSGLRRDGTYRPERPEQFDFKHDIIESYNEVPANRWYRMEHWKPGTLVYSGEWTRDWRKYAEDIRAVGTTYEGRVRTILNLASRPDFRVLLTKHSENPQDPNAVAVWAIAHVSGENRSNTSGTWNER